MISLFSSGPTNEDIDEGFNLLYPGRDELEERCFGSLQAKQVILPSTKATTTSTSCTDDNAEPLGYYGCLEPNQTPPNYKASNDLETNLKFIYGTVGDEYFDPEYDPNIKILSDYKSKKFYITEKFLSRLEEYQRTKENVDKVITKLIEENYSRMIEYFTDLNVVDTNLLATTHAIDSVRRKLANNICNTQNNASIVICSEKREKLLLLQRTCKGLKLFKDLFSSLEKNKRNNENAVATEQLYHCLHTIQSGSNAYYSKFVCLQSIITKLHDMINHTLEFSIHQLKITNCRKFERNEFGNLIKCFLFFDLISKDIEIERSSLKENIDRQVSNFVDMLLQTQQQDINKALHFCAAIFAGNNGDCDLSTPVDGSIGTIKILELHNKVPAEKAHLCVLRTVTSLADVLLTHCHFINWFEVPLVETDNGGSEEGDEEVIVFKKRPCQESSNGVNNFNSSILTRILCNSNPRFSIFRGEVSLGRRSAWSSIVHAITDMLNGLKLTSKVKMSDYFVILWAINSLLIVGRDFCENSSSTQQLQVAVVEKSFAYFSDIYAHSKTDFKTALVSNLWDECPIEYSSEICGIQMKGIHGGGIERKLLFKEQIIENFYSFPI